MKIIFKNIRILKNSENNNCKKRKKENSIEKKRKKEKANGPSRQSVTGERKKKNSGWAEPTTARREEVLGVAYRSSLAPVGAAPTLSSISGRHLSVVAIPACACRSPLQATSPRGPRPSDRSLGGPDGTGFPLAANKISAPSRL